MLEKYDRIGRGYNQKRQADPFLFSMMEELLAPSQDHTYLDIGCGTGNYTLEFAKKGHSFIGVEPSHSMLEVARNRSSQIEWLQGRAEDIPLENERVAGSLASLTLHHWTDIPKGMKEMARVLKPNANVVIFTSDPIQMEGYWLNHYFPNMLQKSIRQMPQLSLIRKAMEDTGLELLEEIPYFVKDDLQDHFLYVGKNKPKHYLNPAIRNGISSFRDLALQTEVQQGLSNLEKDIQSGQIREVMGQYQNELGDYLFVKARKQGLG